MVNTQINMQITNIRLEILAVYNRRSYKSGRILFVYLVGRLETEWMLVSGKVGPMDVAARSSTFGGDENST
ncbi:hypothetical protein M0802_014386 [Mischocyttarus mexicanus]|nr:hypothetical protein M0802_014386 [Mischocyttarus mexicanus]